MSYYSFIFDGEIIETSIDKKTEPDGSEIYKLVLAEKEVSKKLGSDLEIKLKDGTASYVQPNMQTQTEYASSFLKRFKDFLGWARNAGWSV